MQDDAMSKARILIVEDSLIVAFHLQKTLEKEGYQIIGAEASGERALTLVEKNRPDLVLMDIMLSGQLDGIETALQIRKKYHLPVIFLTALSDSDTIQRAKITEPFGYLTKPFEDREVFTVIEMALYKHQIEQRLRESEEKYFSTVRSISDAVIMIDNQYRVAYMNPSAEIVTGWRLVEAQNHLLFDVVILRDASTHEQPINPFQTSLHRAPLNAIPDNLILVSRKANEKPIEGTLSPIINPHGKFIGLVMIFKDISEKVEHERLIRDFEKRHLAALMEGQEQERSRIAKDLHDGLGQMLNAIKMNVQISGADHHHATNLYRLIDEAIQESVRISENLLPAKLKDFDLATCLRSLCNGIHTASDIPVYFESLGKPVILEQTQKINLYRIAQEAITNAIKHGNAESISVQLNEEDDQVQLTIEDDGVGFKTGMDYDQSVHHGLTNMKERAEIMGGTFTVESDSDRGTLIIVEAPIEVNKRNHAEA
jgi:PAS domain S-box-containing protein